MSDEKMFTTREVPWMKLGHVIDEPVSAMKAAEMADLAFEVEERPLQFHDGSQWVKITDRVALMRKDTHTRLSIVSTGYEILQYGEAFSFIDEIDPHVVAAGPIREGRQAFMVVKAPEHVNVDLLGEDPHDVYVVLRTSHDLTRAVEVSIMPLRGRCMNQLTLSSFTAGVKARWSVPHVKNMHARLAQARSVILNLEGYVTDLKQTAERLAAVDLELDEARKVLELVLPDRPKRDDTVNAIIGRWQHSPTVGYPTNGWGLVNAVSEYFDHGREGRNITEQSRFLGALQGTTRRNINRTAQLLLRR